MPEKREKAITVANDKGLQVELSELGATLYFSQWSVFVSARNAFNKHLENRVRVKNPDLPDRIKGVERRAELTKVFGAISAAELKKAVRAVNSMHEDEDNVLREGTKPEMVEALMLRYAPKRQRKRSLEEE